MLFMNILIIGGDIDWGSEEKKKENEGMNGIGVVEIPLR